MIRHKPRRAVLYARYSTEKQSERSVDDQLRVCARLAEREGFSVIATFSVPAISGGTARRPEYQRMLEAARRGEFDVIVAEDTSRLWRELSELWRALKELTDRGIDVVTQDVDTRRPEYKMLLSVTGAANEAHRDEIARRTRRGLEGRAMAGASTGGRRYGYIPASSSGTGRIEINVSESAVVVRIFEMYDRGYSPRVIATQLNAEGVSSPGSMWARKAVGLNAKRRSKWVASTIHGQPSRGTGILNNECYIGWVTWGRSRWKRGAADSSKRSVSLVQDRAQWTVREETRLRIVPQVLWDRVKARQTAVSRRSENIRVARSGRRASSLLSGLLECAACGSHFIAVDKNFYGCASYKQGGLAACSNTARIKRQHVEDLLLKEITAELLSDEAVAFAQGEIRAELRRFGLRQTPESPSAKVETLDAQADELRRMLKAGRLMPLSRKPRSTPSSDSARRCPAHCGASTRR